MNKSNVDSYLKNPNFVHQEVESRFNKNGDVIVEGDLISKVPFTAYPFKFQLVEGDVDISYVKMDNLENAPKNVRGSFYARCCSLKSLAGVPEKILGEEINLVCNELIDISDLPQFFKGKVDCSHNFICSLPNMPYSSFDFKNNLVTTHVGTVQAGNPGNYYYKNKFGDTYNAFTEFFKSKLTYSRVNDSFSDSQIKNIRTRIFYYINSSDSVYHSLYDKETMRYAEDKGEFQVHTRNYSYPIYI